MAIKFKVLGIGQLSPNQAPIYGPVPAGKTAVLKNMRFVNITGNPMTMNVFIKRTGDTARRVIAKDTAIAAKQMISHSHEITLESTDAIEAYANNSLSVDYVLSGIERDV